MRVYEIVLMPPGHPIILLKSNYFNMAAVSVKRSIEQTLNYGVFAERRLDCMARFSLLSFYDYIPKLINVTNNLHGNDFSVLSYLLFYLIFLQNPYGSLYYYCSYCF